MDFGKGGVREEQFGFLVEFGFTITWQLRLVLLESGFLGSNPGFTPRRQSDSRQALEPLWASVFSLIKTEVRNSPDLIEL